MSGETTMSDEPILYGEQSALAIENFGATGRRIADVPAFIRNFSHVKKAAARANVRLGIISPSIGDAIDAAASEVISGIHDRQFPTALVLGGGGTSTNMNFNEVIAARATQIAGSFVHPNDHVNASQSTNDTYPTAMALTVGDLVEAPLEALRVLAQLFEDKAVENDSTLRLGRTCLQDAVVLSAGKSHSAQATAIRRVTEDLRTITMGLNSIPLGATVLGTGVGAPEGYRELSVQELSRSISRPLVGAQDLIDALAHLDIYASIASAGARAAITLAKISSDLRLLSSGPAGGIGELTLPAVQAGSSIMPGKVNPVVPELVMQLSYRARGAAYSVECAVAAGELELNIMEPVILDSLINIFRDLTVSAETLAQKCVVGLAWNGPRLAQNRDSAFDRWITMASEQGYDAAANEVAQLRTAANEADQ